MRCCIVRWSLLVATLLICLIVLVGAKKFRVPEDRPDYKQLVEKASEQLDKQILDFAYFVLQFEQLRTLLIWQRYERLMEEQEHTNYLLG